MSTYTPITATEFRVVHLLPGQFDDQIQCVLETRPCEIKTSYEALSYEWGTGSVATRPIEMAHHSAPSRAGGDGKVRPSRSAAFRIAQKMWYAARSSAFRHEKMVTFALSVPCAFQLWRWCCWLPIDSPSWTKWIVSREWYLALVCLLMGHTLTDAAIRMPSELLRTKPWLLILDGRIFRSASPPSFGKLAVTPNLELALRHLRHPKRRRTLWIDALCINQEDESEKAVQIQRMDVIYANATAVRIWLGDCHGIGEESPCPELPDGLSHECQHARDMQKTFTFIRSVGTGSRGFFRRTAYRNVRKLFCRDQTVDIEDALLGLMSIVQRKWWRRLWIIQEAALGTGSIYMQCGAHTCEFSSFERIQNGVLKRTDLDASVRDAFRSSRRLVSTVSDFRYYHYHEQDRGEATWASLCAMGIGFITDSVTKRHRLEKGLAFHKHPFPYRLLLVLLNTAGHFECRNDRDRLSAVLGIVGGTMQAPSVVASIFRLLTSPTTLTSYVFADAQVRAAFDVDKAPSVVKDAISTYILLELSEHLHERVKYWTLSRPRYVMTDYREVLDAVANQKTPNDKEAFFCALARYLATKTHSLAFLEAAPCEEKGDAPSWMPKWTREVDDNAYKFARARKDDMARDGFQFMDEGWTLSIVCEVSGYVESVRVIDTAIFEGEYWEHQDDMHYALPKAARKLLDEMPLQVLQALEEADDLLAFMTLTMKEAMQAQKQLFDAVKNLLKTHGTTVLHYRKDKDEDEGEVAFVKAGRIRPRDRIVAVPGCYHHLAIRPDISSGRIGTRWRLVGLVFPAGKLIERHGEPGYSKAEWERLRSEGKLGRCNIV